MACNCGKNKQSVSYVYTAPGGAKTTYKSEIEAQAAVIRGTKDGKKGSYVKVSQ